jgi:prepilin-type N-terminal cleavage/methylation domain-containing protein
MNRHTALPCDASLYGRQANRSGFTLVELIIVMAVIVMLSVIAAPALSTLLKTSKVQEAANIVMAALYRTRGEAVRARTQVGLFFGDSPSRHPAARWQPPLSTTLPPDGTMEIWSVEQDKTGNTSPMYRNNAASWTEDGFAAIMSTPKNPAGGSMTYIAWFPWYVKINLISRPISLPGDIRIVTGTYWQQYPVGTTVRKFNTGDTAMGSFTPDRIGEIKRHNIVFSSNGTIPCRNNYDHTFRYILIFDQAQNSYVVIEAGEFVSLSRPKVVNNSSLWSLNNVTLTPTSDFNAIIN